MAKDKDPKERDWDREMREVDKLLAKLPEADPTLGRGVPTVPVSPRAGVAGMAGAAALHPAGPARGRAWLTTWLRVGLGVGLGIGMLVWPYTHACGLKLVFYLIGATTVTVAGVWSALTSWKRRLGIAHTLSIILIWRGESALGLIAVALAVGLLAGGIVGWMTRPSLFDTATEVHRRRLGRSLDGRVLREPQPGGLERCDRPVPAFGPR